VRVGIDVSPLVPGRTGVGNYVYYLLKYMLEQEDGIEFSGLAVTRSRVDLAGLPAANLPVKHIRMPTRLMYALWNRSALFPVERLVGDVDLYHGTNFYLPPARSAKLALTIHDLSFMVHPQYSSPKIVGPFSKHVRRFSQRADLILVYSEATRADLERLLDVPRDKIVAAPMAVDDCLAPVERDRARAEVGRRWGLHNPYILFVGMLEPRKNIPSILRAFDAIRDTVNHDLVLAGDKGWECREIFRLVDELGLRDRARFIGFVPHTELAPLYSAADAFVFPSFYEGFGLPPLEAMKCGCPVVAADNSSMPEVLGDAALLVSADDWRALASSLENVLTDERLRSDLITRGLNRVQSFSWRRCAEQTIAAYRRIVEG